MKVAVVGAGVSGICATIKLKERFGADADITVIEKGSDIGGTWFYNHYPGAECDVPSHFYSFSFERNPAWTQYYSPQREIHSYLKAVAHKHGVEKLVRFNTEFVGAKWDDAKRQWLVRTRMARDWNAPASAADAPETTTPYDAIVISSAALNRPAIPSFPGLTSFKGEVFHTAQWNDAFNPADKRVAVIGTGASAVQVIPAIAPKARHVDVYQRTPGWVVPRGNYKYPSWLITLFTVIPLLSAVYRFFLWIMRDIIFFPAFTRGTLAEKYVRRLCTTHLAKSVGKHNPELIAKLTPDYPPGCKRLLVADDYLTTLTKPHVSLVTSGITRVTPTGIVTADGVEHPCDVIVMATGFQVTSFLSHVELTGRGGQCLSERWRNPDNVEAYHGTMVSGLPNAFILMGPNTALGHSSMIFIIETQVDYMVKVLAEKARRGAAVVDVPQPAQDAYNKWLQRDLSKTVWAGSCQSWYKTATGKLVTLWPHSTLRFYLTLARPKFTEMDFTTAA